MKTLLAMTLLVLISTTCSEVRSEDWPGWRGPRGDGTSQESIVPLNWSPTDNIVWKTAIPGMGRSSPIVVGRRVFITTGEATDQSRRVLCFNRDTGELHWNVTVHQGSPGQMHKFNSTASSTPVADDERVYSVFADDKDLRVVGVRFDGKIAWSVSPGNFQSQHGFASSPVLFDQGVIVNGHQDGEAFVVMLDRTTGTELWRYKPQVNLRSFSTPVLIQHDGQDQLILAGASQTVALAPLTGKPIWYAEGPSQKFVSTPVIGCGFVFSFGGSPDKRAMAVRLGGSGDVSSSHVAWRNERAMPYVPTPIFAGELLHIISDTGIYTCLDPRTGESRHTGRKLGPVNSSPVSAAGRIYFFEDSGTCTVTNEGPEFEILAKNELNEPVYTTPAICAGSLFVRTETNLIRIGAPIE